MVWVGNREVGKRGMRFKILFIICLLLGLSASPAMAAKIYRCVDARDHVTFQQTPCPEPEADTTTSHQDGRHLLWRLAAAESTVYLLGSIHFGEAGMYPLPAGIEAAFASADVLVVEVNTAALDPARTARLVAFLGTYQDGGNLRQAVDGATWQKLQQAAEAMGLPVKMLARQKPWFAAMTLAMAALQKSGYDSRWGIDTHFLQRATAEGMPIMELETLEEQLRLFDDLPAAVQQAMLLQSLHELERSAKYFGTMLKAWQRGDATALERLIKSGFEDTAEGRQMYEVFLTRRNIKMTDKIEQLLSGRRTYFVIVGAAHLVGEEGIVSLLAQRGYQASQL